jgi:hypothetical protein
MVLFTGSRHAISKQHPFGSDYTNLRINYLYLYAIRTDVILHFVLQEA